MANHVGKETADEGWGNLERAKDAAADPIHTSGMYYGEGSPLAESDDHKPPASEHEQPPSSLSLSSQPVKSSWEQFALIQCMPADMAKTVIGCMRPRTFVKGQVVVQHNSVGSSIFFVDYGQLQASLNGKVLEEIRPGAVYGELAFIGACRKLLIEAPDVKDWSVLLRSCRITSVSDCRCFELTTNDFLAAMRKAGYSAQDVTKVLEPIEPIERARRANLSRHMITRISEVLERNVLEDAMSEDASATRTLPGLPRAQAECRADAEGFAVDLGCNGPAEVVPTRSKAQAYINEELDLMKRRGALR